MYLFYLFLLQPGNILNLMRIKRDIFHQNCKAAAHGMPIGDRQFSKIVSSKWVLGLKVCRRAMRSAWLSQCQLPSSCCTKSRFWNFPGPSSQESLKRRLQGQQALYQVIGVQMPILSPKLSEERKDWRRTVFSTCVLCLWVLCFSWIPWATTAVQVTITASID